MAVKEKNNLIIGIITALVLLFGTGYLYNYKTMSSDFVTKEVNNKDMQSLSQALKDLNYRLDCLDSKYDKLTEQIMETKIEQVKTNSNLRMFVETMRDYFKENNE